jgi:hypothetical protein
MKKILLALILCLSLPAFGYEVNGVRLGGKELDVKKAFPSVHCKPLEWKSDAADRRCDDAKIPFGGVEARVTFYLKSDVIRGFDVRFDTSNLAPVADYLKRRYGKPLSEAREKIVRKNKEEREVFKILWEAGQDKAMLSALSTGKRGSLSVSRGNFDNEIYRVK